MKIRQSADNDSRLLSFWHEWTIVDGQRLITLCVETDMVMQPEEPGYDAVALQGLVSQAHSLVRSSPSPINAIRIVPRR